MRKALVGSTLALILLTGLAAPLARADDPTAAPTSSGTAASTATATDLPSTTPAPTTTDSTTPASQESTPTDSAASPEQTSSTSPIPTPTAPTGDFCTDYPLVGQDLFDLTQYYNVATADTDATEPPDFTVIRAKMVDAAAKMDILLADHSIPSHLSDALAWLKGYFQQLTGALTDARPDIEGQQFTDDQLTLISDLMSDSQKTIVDGRIHQLTLDGYAYCGEEPPPSLLEPLVPVDSATSLPPLSPDNVTIVQSGTRYTITGRGFQPSESVTGSVTGVSVGLGTRLADAAGTVTFTWIAPPSFKPAGQSVTLTGAKSGSVTKKFGAQSLAGTGDPAGATPVGVAGFAALLLSASFALAALAASGRALRQPAVARRHDR